MSFNVNIGIGSNMPGSLPGRALQPPKAVAPNEPAFIPANAFKGSKPGYYFTSGSKGVGYYLDRKHSQAVEVGSRKRKHDEAIASENSTVSKQLGYNDREDGADDGIDSNEIPGEILEKSIDRLLEEAEKSGLTQLDSQSLKQMLLNFEKKINKNQKLRMKYPSEPSKFMESEIELNDQIQELYAIAAYPELYVDVVENGSLPSILGMITHENTDISISAVGLLQELLEADTIAENPEAIVLVEEFVNQLGLELITQNLDRLDEINEEDAQGVYNTLSIIENLIEIRQDLASRIGSSTRLFPFLLNRIRNKDMDANKLYASEILSILLQSSKSNRLLVSDLVVKSSMANISDDCNGLDALCQGIAPYRKRDPQSSDETEMLDNLFLCLFSMLLESPNQLKFIEIEGFELMMRCLKDRKHAAGRAMKALDFAMKSLISCLKFIESGGLKYIYPILLGRGLPQDLEKKKASHPDRLELDQACISIISQICLQFLTIPVTMKRLDGLIEARYISTVSDKTISEDQQRFLGKFLENDFEKIERLVDLFIKYRSHVVHIEHSINDSVDEELDEEEILAKRIEGGLDHVQNLAIILAYASMIDNSTLLKIDSRLTEYQLNILHVYSYIEEYVDILEHNLEELKQFKDAEAETSNDSTTFLDDEIAIERMLMVKEKYLQVLVASGVVDMEDADVVNGSASGS